MDARWVAWWIGVLSVLDFALTVADKGRAQARRGRIRERTLLGLALLGGSPGLVVGMLVARHKTRKPSFVLGLALIVIVQAGLAYLALR